MLALAPREVITHIELWYESPFNLLVNIRIQTLYVFSALQHGLRYHTPGYAYTHSSTLPCMDAGILSRVKSGGTFPNVGTGFGQELRHLAADGAPGRNMRAIDPSSNFWELGYCLLEDRGRLDAKLTTVNSLSTDDDKRELKALKAKVDVIHTGSFFRLSDWGDQVEGSKRLLV